MRAALERPEHDPDAGTAVVEVDLYMDGENVFLRGILDGWVEVACGRCLGPARIVLAEPLHVTFRPASQLPAEDEEDAGEGAAAEAAEADVDLYAYQGEEVDLEPLFREQIILAVPFAPLCREDCKGLCPVCGTDLNTAECGCDRTPIDPRWSALKNLKA
jgi:uncharacterized protein